MIRPQAIEGAEELERERQRLEAYISELHKVADKFLGAQRAAKGEASMQTIIEKVLPDGRIVYESAASPDFKREAARKIREEWAAIELERETKRRAGVAASRTVFSAPTPFLNRSVSLDQWLDLLEGLMPRTKPKRKHEKGKIKRSGAVINAENEEAINEFEYLFTHLAQNPLLIQTAHDNPGNSQIDRLFELMSHPWFGTETAPGAGNKPAGQKQVEVPNGKMDRFIDGKTVQIERSQRLTKDPDKRSTWYFVHPQHGRIEFGPNQHRSIVDEADQLTLAIRSILVETQQRQSDLNAVAHGRKLFEIDETALPPGQPDTEASVDLSPGGQEDMFGKGEEEPGDLYLTEPQYELNLTEDQTVAAIRRAHQTVANYYGLWKTGDATERQLSQLHTSMKIIASFQAENEESWGFKTEDIIALDAHFGNQRATGVKERRLDVETGELFDYYGLDPTGVPGVTGGGPRGFVDFIPTMSMPGAGQIGDDAELQKKYKAEMEEKGLAHLWKKGKIPSRRDAVRMIGRALMTPITTGRTKLGKSWGRFYSHFRSIRTKWAYDMEGVGHEVGHAIMHLIWEQEAYTKGGALSNRVLMSWDHELGQFGQDYAKWQGQEGEGVPRLEWFAEYIRRYISNRAETTKAAPELTKFMEAELLKREPGVQEALDFATFVWKHWRNQTPEARILSQFMFAKEVHDDRAWSWIMVPPLVRIKRAWWDLHVPFDTIVQTFNPGMSITDPRIPLDENPALLVRLMGGAAASGDESWMYGITDAETGMRTSEGPEKLILAALNYEGFASQQEGFALLTAYGAALRNIERAQVAIKRAEQWAERLNERHNEAGRFVVRESEVEPGAFDVFDLRTDKVIGRRFKQYILGMSYQDSLEVVKNAEAQGYKEIFDTTMEGLYAFSNARLDWLVQMGVLTQENAEVVKEGSRFYVPMVPVIEKLDQRKAEYQRAYPRHELSKVPGAPRRQKAPGSAAQKRNWIDQLYIDTQYLTLLGMRQRTIQSLYNMTKRHRGTGVFLEAIAKPVTATPVELRQMIDRMGEFVDSEMLDYMKDNIDSETMNEMLMVFAPGDYMNNIDTVRVRDPETNEIKWLQVNDPELLGALLGIESQSSPALKAVTMTWVAKSLRLGATLSPGFSLYRNPGRDSIQAWIMSEWGIKIGYDHVRAMYHMIGKDELYQKFLQSGAAFSSLLDFDQRGIARKVQKAQRSKIVNVVGDAVEALKILGTWTENMNRFAEYERAYETLVGQGVGEMEARTRAAYAARDVTVDFWRHGYQTAAIRQMVAFWNANLQGWSKMSRTARENPGRFAWRTFQGITVPSMLLWLVNHDDDEYKALPNWLKDFYWLIPLDPGMVVGGMMGALTGNPAGVAAGAVAGHTLWDKLFLDELEGDDPGEQRTDPRDIISPVISRGGKAWLKFPKPFFMGQAFGTLAERGLDWAHGEDPEFADRLKEMFWDEVIAITPLPTGWRGILQLIPPRGYDMFRQRPLMGQEMAERDSWTQYTPGTSRGARWLGKAAADVGFRGGQGLSPVKIDNLMYSYFGTLMRDAVKLSDLGIRISGQVAAGVGAVDEPWGTDVAAGRSPAQLLPLIGDLIQVWPYGASSHVDRIHKLWDEADRKYRTHGHLFKEDIQLRRDGAGARAYLDANPGVFGEYAEVAAAYALLRVLDYRISAIQHDPDLSDKEKLLGMADLWNEKDITARSALERFEGGNK